MGSGTQLEFFLMVVEQGKLFFFCCSRLTAPQPAVSIAIRRLEEEIGAAL